MNAWWNYLEKRPKLCWLISAVWLLGISWVAFLWNLGSIGLMDKSEGLYVEVAHQIFLTNDWVSPRWNGAHFYSYPVGGYWLMALSFRIFGVSEWAARFPVALLAIAVVVLAFYTLRYFGVRSKKAQTNQQQLWMTAWIGAGIVALNPAWVAWGRSGVSDMFVSSGIALAMLAFFLGYAQPERHKAQQGWYIAFPVFMAIAVMAKGPIGIILPVLGIGCFLLYVGKFWQVFREIRPLRTIVIFLTLTLPWYVAATLVDGKIFIDEFIGFSNFQRFTSVIHRHPGPWYFYIIWVTVLMLPWSIYLPLAIARLRFWRLSPWRSSPRSSHLGLFAFFWFVTIFLFFSSAATKLAGYILPLIPAVAIMITLFWSEQLSETETSKSKSWFFILSGIVNVVILIALAVASFYSPTLAGSDTTSPTLEQALRESGLPIILTLIWGVAALGTILLLCRRLWWRWLWSPTLLGFLAFLSLVFPPLIPLLDAQKQTDFRNLSVLVGQIAQPQEELFVMGYRRYSAVHYSQRQVQFFDDVQYARNYLEDPERHQNNSPTVLILGQPKFTEKFGLRPQDYELINRRGAYQLIRVAKSKLIS